MIFLSAIVAAILSAQPVEESLWTDEFPQPDKVEDKADAKIFIHHPLIPTVLQPLFARAVDTAGRSWELRGMASPAMADDKKQNGITGLS